MSSPYDLWKLDSPQVYEGGCSAADPECEDCGGSGRYCDDYERAVVICSCIARRKEQRDQWLWNLCNELHDVVCAVEQQPIRVGGLGSIRALSSLFGDLAEVEA